MLILSHWGWDAPASEQDQEAPATLADEREVREQIIQRGLEKRKSADKDTLGGFIRLINFSSYKKGFDAYLKAEGSAPVRFGLNVRYVMPYSYVEVPVGEYEIILTATSRAPLTDDDFGENAAEQKPIEPDKLKKLATGISLKIKPDSCFSLLVVDEGSGLQAELIEDAPLIDEEDDPRSPELILYKIEDSEVVDTFWREEGLKKGITITDDMMQIIQVEEPWVQKEFGLSFLDERDRKRTRTVTLDYQYGQSFSVFFMTDQYGKIRLRSAENGLREAILNNTGD